jgi:hypothetical protein
MQNQVCKNWVGWAHRRGLNAKLSSLSKKIESYCSATTFPSEINLNNYSNCVADNPTVG